MKKISICFKYSLLLLFCLGQLSSVSAVDKFLFEANNKLLKAKSFRFDFNQSSVMTNFEEILNSEGYMLYQAPEKAGEFPKIYLEFTKPEEERQLVVFDGKTLWTYRQNINQVYKQEVSSEDMKQNAMVFIPQWLDGIMRKSNIEFNGETPEKWMKYTITPEEPEMNMFRKVELFLEPIENDLKKYVMMDNNNNLIEVEIKTIKYDLKIDPRKFVFKKPENANVVEYQNLR